MTDKPTIPFQEVPAGDDSRRSQARRILDRAKGRSSSVPKAPEVRDSFAEADAYVQEDKEARSFLRPETVRGLEEMAEHVREQTAESATGENPAPIEDNPEVLRREDLRQFVKRFAEEFRKNQYGPLDETTDKVLSSLGKEPLPSEAEIKRRKWEESASLKPLDIERYIINGLVRQRIPIIPGKLFVTFRSTTDAADSFVAYKLRVFRTNAGKELTTSDFFAEQARYAMACSIVEYNGEEWSRIYDADGSINPEGFSLNLQRISRIPSLIIQRISQHLAWFSSRVDDMLKDVDSVGNG